MLRLWEDHRDRSSHTEILFISDMNGALRLSEESRTDELFPGDISKVLINDAGGDFQLSVLKEANRVFARAG